MTHLLLTSRISFRTGLLTGALSLFIATGLYGTTYYVDSQNGNDNYDGQAAAFQGGNTGPWATIAKVNSIFFAPGDSILFRKGGVWTDGPLEPLIGGAPGNTNTVQETILGQPVSFGLVDLSDNNCIYFGPYGEDPAKPLIECRGEEGIIIRHDYIIVEGFHLNNGGNNVLWFGKETGNYWNAAIDIDVTHSLSNAVASDFGGGNLWLKGLYVYDYGTNGILMNGSLNNKLKGVLIEDCRVENPLTLDLEDGITCHDDAAGNRIDGDVIIRNNTIIRAGEDGIDITSGTNILLEGNYIRESWSGGIYVVKSWVNTVEIRNNFLYSNSFDQGVGDLTIEVPHVWAYNNVIAGTGHHCLHIGFTDDTKIWNNVIAPENRTGNLIWFRDSIGQLEFHNNIFDFTGADQDISGVMPPGIVFDYNCYHTLSADDNIYGNFSFQEMRDANPLFEPNGFRADPQFADPAKSAPGHFQLESASPCIDAGTTVSAPTDYWGTPRPQGQGFDIGIYEQGTIDCDPDPNVTAYPGSPCDDGDNTTDNDVYNTDCICAGTPNACAGIGDADGDGICADVDCNDNDPAIAYQPGDACDDGNPTTSGETIQADCTCAGGTPGPATVCSRVSSSADDAEEKFTGTMDLGSSDLELTYDPSRGRQVIGLRFTGLNIPQGATILSAHVQFTADETFNDNPCRLRIFGENAGNALPLADIDDNISSRPRTSASVLWAPPDWLAVPSFGPGERTPDIHAVLQEIVNRPDYDAGNAIAIIIDGIGGRAAEAFDGFPSQAPELCVEYTLLPVTYDCPALSANIGYPCDDGDPTTINDAIDADCNCIGTPTACSGIGDADGDGVCSDVDCDDNDFFTDTYPGDTCDDGDNTTINDTIDANCNCVGTPTACTGIGDADDDGICTDVDCNDDDPNITSFIGQPCDDGDSNTVNDVIGTDCNCAGTINPCIGSADNDGDGVCANIDCNDNDPSITYQPGDACDDGDHTTLNDIIDTDCNCMGTPTACTGIGDNDNDGVCADVDCDDNNPNITTQDADGDGLCSDVDCDDNNPNIAYQPGDACNDGDNTTINDVIGTNCTCAGTPTACTGIGDADADGVCADVDCNDNHPGITTQDADGDGLCSDVDCDDNDPNIAYQPGDACDDGDNTTINDVIGANCSCAGTPTACTGIGDADNDGVCADVDCDDNNPNVTTLDGDGDGLCSDVDCDDSDPSIAYQPGDACDDGNPGTSGETIQQDCTCGGGAAPASACSRVSMSSDDAEEGTGGAMSLNSSDLELINDSGEDQTVGMRFSGLGIPQGATITSATIQFAVDETRNSDPCILTIQGQASDNPPTFSGSNFNISNRPRTSASVAWAPPDWASNGDAGPDQQTPDIASIIQEVVNRPGYASTSSIVLIIEGTGRRTAESFDGSSAQAAELCVEYLLAPSYDCPALSANFGDACDDNDNTTVNDVIGTNCTCAGTPTACTGIGDADNDGVCADVDCDDNDPNVTTQDADGDGLCSDVDCDDNNPGIAYQPGDDCDDGDITTVNDVIGTNCTCAGTPTACTGIGDADNDGVCADVDCDDNDPNVTTLDADGDGLCDDVDCDDNDPNIAYQPGDDCDDGDPNTTGDAIQQNCTCSGNSVTSTTVCSRVNANNNDAEEDNSGTVNLTSSDLELTEDPSQGIQAIGMRFNGLGIPQGATITGAHLQFAVDELRDLDPCNLAIYGEASDNALAFSNSNHNITSRPRTNAAVAWAPQSWTSVGAAGPAQQTPDIASIIQEVVNRSGYTSNSSIVILIDGSGRRTAESYDGSPTQAPELCVEYFLAPTYDCPAISANIGDACDDGDNTTINDQIGANCGCAGTPTACTGIGDADGDGICADVDCDDNDPNITTQDADGDGICSDVDCNDNPATGGANIAFQPGDACDDGDDTTINDTIDNDCNCMGTPTACAGIGDNDGDGICADVDCDDNNPNITMQAGDACDDGDNTTVNDIVGPNCICAGTPTACTGIGDNDGDGVCSFADCDDNDPNITTQPGDPCDDGDNTTVNDAIDPGCNCAGTPTTCTGIGDNDGDGVCADTDCNDNDPNITTQPGDPCDDGDNTTVNDVIGANCNCAGTPTACTGIGDADGDGICADTDCNDNNPNITTQPGDACDDGDSTTLNDSIDADCNCAGTPTACTGIGDADGDGICADTDCDDNDPGNTSQPGDACDDGDNTTVNDQLDNNCNCAGTPTACTGIGDADGDGICADTDCDDNDPGNTSQPGDACDDGDNTTVNDQLDANCNCAGTPTACTGIGDADGDGICADTDCDDNDPNNTNQPGDACNDGDPATVGDIIQQDCSCSGSPAIPTTTCSRISHTNDDAEEDGTGTVDLTSSDLELTEDPSQGVQTIGMRFNGLSIPQGATITGAHIQFAVDETRDLDPCSLAIYGEASDNAPAFSNNNHNISSRTRTAASVSWMPPAWTSVGAAGPAQQTPDIASVIQEVVNRSGYTSGSSIVILIDGIGRRTAESYSGSPTTAPELCVEYLLTPSYDCPVLFADIGDPCDDGDNTTVNDAIGTNCNCVGIPTACTGIGDNDSDSICADVDCDDNDSGVTSQPGDACDDGDNATVDDVLDADCNCAGTPSNCVGIGDADADGICADTDCDDDDPNITTQPGDACDDGDPATVGDVIQQDCTCDGSPAIPVTACSRVSAGNDDAEEDGAGSVDLTSSDLELTDDPGHGIQLIGMRFNGLGIPQGAVITGAHIQFAVDETQNINPCGLTIYGEASNNAPAFSNSNYNISSRMRTTASVSWTPPGWTSVGAAGAAQRTPDIASVIQEVVNRSGYTANSSIVVLIDGAGRRTAESFDGSPATAPQLCVEYILSSTGIGARPPAGGNSRETTNNLAIPDADAGEALSATGMLSPLSIHPNPASDRITVSFQSATEGPAQVVVRTFNGAVAFRQEQTVHQGANSLALKGLSLPSGLYFLQVRAGQAIQSAKFVIARE
ncbi:MAG: T9SS type A sorting domain-containing protein [Lewinellaceae bacterium]|nr:T9SS type A sorting domain-containing protein [Lewinellaceae bacterium]